MTELHDQKCKPCEGIGESLTREEALRYLSQVEGWQLSEDGKWIIKTITAKNFSEAVNVINEIKNIAEKENHHPDIHLTAYRNLKVELTTHALGGLTQNDFILATKINKISIESKKT